MNSKRTQTTRRSGTPEQNAKSVLFDLGIFFETAARGRSIRHIRRTRSSFRKGDVADAVFYIKEGKVKVVVVSKQGKEAVVALLGADEFFGEGCLIGQPKRLAAAITMSDCTITQVGKNEIQRLIREEPLFSQMFKSHILTKKDHVEADFSRSAL